MAMRMREYAVNADYSHNREYADADENLIHIRGEVKYYFADFAHICKYADEDENLIHIIHI